MRLLLSLSMVSMLCACGNVTRTETERPRSVKAVTASSLRYIDKDFAGMATADDATNLAFKISGQVLRVDVSKGDAVIRGDLLAVLDPRDVELQVSANRSGFEEARSRVERMKRLLEHQAVSRQEYESAQTQFSQARARYENALDLLNDTKLRAPFSGVIERTYVDAFERVNAGQSILRLVNPVSTTVGFTVPESGLSQVAEAGTAFSVEFDNYRGVRFDAVLKDLVRTSSDASGFPVSLRIENPDPGKYGISPGMSCVVTVRVEDDMPDVVALPLSAIYAPSRGGEYVWVIGDDDRVELRGVALGEIFGRDMVVVDSGVEPGEKVVTAGVYRLREGERVRIIE